MRGFRGGRFGWGYRRPFVRPRPFYWRPTWHARPLYWGLGLFLFPGLCLASAFLLPLFRLLAR